MINGQGYINAGDFYIAHNPGAIQVQEAFILGLLVRTQNIGIFSIYQRPIIIPCCGKNGIILPFIQPLHLLGVSRHRC